MLCLVLCALCRDDDTSISFSPAHHSIIYAWYCTLHKPHQAPNHVIGQNAGVPDRADGGAAVQPSPFVHQLKLIGKDHLGEGGSVSSTGRIQDS